jgi:phosphate-selective porin OprO/OprP
MFRTARRSAAGAFALAATLAPAARAADDDVRALVKEEIQSYMDAKKKEDTSGEVLEVAWKDGSSFESPDKRFKAKIGGRLHVHNVLGDVPDEIRAFDIPGPGSVIGEWRPTFFFRRARLFLEGDIDEHVKFKLQVDFAGGDADFKDASVQLHGLKGCLGCWMPTVTVGQFKEPFSLEELTSSNYITMVERSVMNTLVPGRSLGVMLSDSFWQDRATLSVGVFAADGEDDELGVAEWRKGWALTARATTVPLARDTCHLLHLGASASYREVPDLRLRARPDTGTGIRFVDTGTMDMDATTLLGVEAAVVWGSLSLQAEHTWAFVDAPTLGDPQFSAWYAMASWFVTGEARNYRFSSGAFDKVKPCVDFFEKEGCCLGAVELKARYGTIDLTDGLVTGGRLEAFTAGVNWYLNTSTRLMLEYVHAIPDHPGLDSSAHFVLTALQVWF